MANFRRLFNSLTNQVIVVSVFMGLCISAAKVMAGSGSGSDLVCASSPSLLPSQFDSEFYGSLAECPSGSGFRLLPSTTPAQAIIVGYTGDPGRLLFFKDLIRAIEKNRPEVKIKVLIQNHFLNAFKKSEFSKDSHLQTIVIKTNETADMTGWPQDVMSLGVTGETPQAAIMIFPYKEKTSTLVQETVARSCELSPVLLPPSEQNTQSSMGGNILAMPGGVVLTGTGVEERVLNLLKEQQTVVEIKTDWLTSAHVDELFSVVPNGKPGACNFTVLRASPRLALELMSRASESFSIETSPGLIINRANWKPKNCLSALGGYGKSVLSKEALDCPLLIQSNSVYERMIQVELTKVTQALIKATGCDEIPIEELPILYQAQVIGTQSSYSDEQLETMPTRSFNANPVNAISMQKLILVPRQPNTIFAHAIRQALIRQNTKVEFVDTSDLHSWGGEAHCATNVIRACKAKGSK